VLNLDIVSDEIPSFHINKFNLFIKSHVGLNQPQTLSNQPNISTQTFQKLSTISFTEPTSADLSTKSCFALELKVETGYVFT